MTKAKIMIIDDSSTIGKTADMFLSKEGYTVVRVDNGFDALSAIIEEKPDMIFIDVLMPKLGGLETCRIIKNNPSFEDTPLVVLSSKDGLYDKAKGLMAGADDYLIKPFSKQNIIDMINKFL